MTRQTRHLHLLPVLSFLPFVVILLLMSQTTIILDPLLIGAAVIVYLMVNIIYRWLHGTLKVGYIVEYSLIGLIVFFVLGQYS